MSEAELDTSSKIRIEITNDIDGVLNWGLAAKTHQRLKKGTFAIPAEDAEIQKKETKNTAYRRLLEQVLIWYHQVRPLWAASLEGLQQLQELKMATSDDIEISLSVLSGREPYLHAMTRSKLTKQAPNIFDDMYLNEGYKSAAWKELKARQLVGEGKYVFHIEDDLQAALQIARVDGDKVRVYLLRRRSNSPHLLQKNNIHVSENITFVDSYTQAVYKIKQRVEGLFVGVGNENI